MLILDRLEVEALDLAECEQTLKKIYKDKLVDIPLDNGHPYWSQIDPIINTICYLEDRAEYLTKINNIERANNARWGRVAEMPQIPPPDEGFDD